jgi:hypothetical protein
LPSPLDRRTFLTLLAAGTVSGAAWSGLTAVVAPGADAPAAAATGSSSRVDGVVRLGRSYLHDHPAESDATQLRSLLPGLDATKPVRPQLPALAPASVGDFEAGRVVFVDGWHLAFTEARASAAVALGA